MNGADGSVRGVLARSDAVLATEEATGDVDGDVAAEGAVEALFRARHDASVRLAAVLVGDVAVAEEIVQDAFLEVSRRWVRLDDPAAYLRTVIVNRCGSHQRRRAMIRRRALPPLPLQVDAPELDELWSVLARLSPRRRAALVLRYYEDLPGAEIARLLRCRPGTVSSLLHRGLADLREVLDSDS